MSTDNPWYKKDDHQHNLNNVLAALNSDGGHYQLQHGTEAAIDRGLQRFYEARAAVREREEEGRV